MSNNQKYWEKFADEYNGIVGDEGDENHRLVINPIILDLLEDLTGDTILDAGCGNGYFSKILSEKAKKIIGVDFTAKLIEFAKNKYSNTPNLEFSEQNLEKLSFSDGFFDVVVCTVVLIDVENLEAVVNELSRVLKPNGKLIISITHPCFENPPHTYTLIDNGKKLGRVINDYYTTGLIPDPEHNYQHYHYKISDYLNTFSKAGLVIEKTVEPNSAVIKKNHEPDFTPTFLIMKLRKF